MNCQKCREHYENLLDESLSQEERSKIEAIVSAHLEICPECASEYALVQNLRLTLPQLQATMVEPPTFLRANIRAALVEEVQAKSQKKSFFTTPFWARPLWAGSLVVAFGFLLMSPQLIQFSQVPTSNEPLSSQDSSTDGRNRTSAESFTLKESDSRIPTTKKNQNLTKDGDIVLAERTPAPRPKVFAGSSPVLDRPEPLSLPKSDNKTASLPSSNLGNDKKTDSPTKSTIIAGQSQSVTQSPLPAPNKEENISPRVVPAPAKAPLSIPKTNEGDNFIANATPPTASDLMVPENRTQPDWRKGKITLVLAHAPVSQGFAAPSSKNALPRGRSVAPIGPMMEAAPTAPITNNSVDSTQPDRAFPFEPKINRGGGDTRKSIQAAPPTYAAPAPLQPVECKLTLQSEFAVPNARLLQNGNLVWQGDLPANKPVEVKWLAPKGTTEKNSFVLEQIGPNNESYRKSLDLSD